MKFSLRDLFLVTVIVALALGWWLDHRRLVVPKNEFDDMKFAVEAYQRYIRNLPSPDSSAPAPSTPKP